MQSKKYKKGYVPGVYDLFHVGHLNLIHRAKEQSEYLLAGVLSDELVVHFKGKRPYIPFEERIAIVEAVREVDAVVKVDFSNTVKMDAWKLYHFDAYFSGDDHGNEWDKEKKVLQKVGSDIVFLPYTKSTSSTMIKEKIQKENKKKRLYLFGAGRIGQRIRKELEVGNGKNKWEVAGFLDNSPQKHLTRVLGVPVYKPEDLGKLEAEGDFSIFITMKDADAAIGQIQMLGFGDNMITPI